ncbi:MAG: hypothetical protein N4A38_01590 [Candidatus Gracilibacteria bacterium]|nr:hypothetical protein [Candidatus Gracilibacteria bacterium]
MKNYKKILIISVLSLVSLTNVLAGGKEGQVDNGDYIDNEVNSTIKEIDQAIEDNKDLTEYIYYYSKTCSHCAKVQKFFDDNKIEEKFNVIKKDTGDYSNIQGLLAIRQALGLDVNMIETPFLVYKENGELKYDNGDRTIIALFEAKLKEFYPEETNKDNKEGTSLEDDITKVGDKEVPDNDNQNQGILLYFIIAGLAVLLGGGGFIIFKKK